MKKNVLFVLVLSCFCIVPAYAQFSTLIGGKIIPAARYELQFVYQYQYLVYNPTIHTIKTNEKGEFSSGIPIQESTWIRWSCQNHEGLMYLHVGDSLQMTIQLAAMPFGVTFTGLGAAENNFLQKWLADYGKESKNAVYPNKFKNLDAQNFKTEVTRLKKNQIKLLEEAIGKQPLSDDFILAMKHHIEYEWANHLAEYPILHAYLNNTTPRLLDESYYSFFNELVIQNPSALKQPAYIRFLKNYMEYHYTQAHQENSLKAYAHLYYPFLWDITVQKFKGSVQAHAQAIVIIQLWENGAKKRAKDFFRRYLEKHRNEKPTTVLKDLLIT